MKTSIICILSLCIYFFLPAADSTAEFYVNEQLTNNTATDEEPQINSSGHIVWSGGDGSDDEILL